MFHYINYTYETVTKSNNFHICNMILFVKMKRKRT